MKPDISIAIIFKNELRCIERCLRSLQPLRERLCVEIVMADTGSTDGSREIAEQYADILFDFPWVNDFAAARNAVLDRCSGAWTLALDCDEWLDADLDELTAFVSGEAPYDGALLLVRNYSTAALDRYMDILLPRLMRMERKPRYEGAIHEAPVFECGTGGIAQLTKTVLHHDGYVMLNDGSAAGEQKRKRNASLLRAELKKTPDDLRRLLQYLESAESAEDYVPTLRRAVALVEARQGQWERFGAAILRRAVFDAYNGDLPELGSWARQAEAMFPQSYYTRIDVMFIRFVRAIVQSDCGAAIRDGESYLRARAAFLDDPCAHGETSVSFLQRNDGYWEQYVRLRLAEAYCASGEAARAGELLRQTDWALLDERHTRYYLEILGRLEANGCDVRSLLSACQAGLDARADENAEACRAVFREMTGTPPELMELASKVQAILSRFPPDDPIAIELKSSDAYRKVAHLIEG